MLLSHKNSSDFEARCIRYSFQNGRIKMTAKGVSRSHVLKNVKKPEDYLYTLQTTKASNATFRTITLHKRAVKTQ